MTPAEILSIIADVAAIGTAVLAAAFFFGLKWEDREQRNRLAAYLKQEKMRSQDSGRRTILQLMSALSMTEEQVMKAAFHHKDVSSICRHNFGGDTIAIEFEYVGDDIQRTPPY